jgi:hypothetical protein
LASSINPRCARRSLGRHSLKELIDDRRDQPATEAMIHDMSAGKSDSAAALSLTISNPPTQVQVQALMDKINELLHVIKRGA